MWDMLRIEHHATMCVNSWRVRLQRSSQPCDPWQWQKAIIMSANECRECKKGHFDFCMANNRGGTLLGRSGGIDNPALMYKKISCPDVLLKRLGLPTSWR